MNNLFNQLSNLDTLLSALMGGVGVQIQPIAGDVPVIQVSIEGRQELPIFVTCSDAQTICLCYLWTDDDVVPERRAELHSALLDLNPSVPLSAFGRVGTRYVLIGALSYGARAEDVAHEVAVLSDNALDALDALADYLR
ncbi:YjfI family protein [Ottowia oryzae]|uniref:DUF2170 domain-containing protein n=1 Tax=Ottowia oryzae TaxID=2109914 RepID=A0A2S0MAI2_9BURK|nr:DUF2170 family protein [Ottowia oryzae]AVO32905.1 DUF2170 domain-containing protein [Ottowia oryzae]